MVISVIGTLFGTSGYASHFRGLVNALNKLTPCKIMTNLQTGWERLVNDQELEMIKRAQDFDINLIITNPLHWRNHLSAKRNWVYLVWEGDKVPGWMAEECLNENIEKIIVPSEHTRLALVKTLRDGTYPGEFHKKVRDKLVVIPHGYNQAEFFTQETKKSDKFKFLMNKGLRNMEDRGGVQYGIKAYIEEFKGDDTELHIKINPAYGIPDILKMFPELESRSDVKFHTANYTIDQLRDLYNNCDVFVSPTRAEAFNLPCLEAMACGKPVITTNFGGQTDFVKDGKTGVLIDYDLVEVEHELEYENIMWAVPDHNHLKTLMRNAFENQESTELKGKMAYEDCKHLTWGNCANQISSLE